MRENRLDSITDKLKIRLYRIIGNAQKQFKGQNPYRQEPIPPKERIMDFAQQTPEDIDFARQQFGDEPVNQYLHKIEELIGRQG